MSSYEVLERHQHMFLNSQGADVWFVFDNERIPAHKCKLKVMNPWLKSMFHGSLPEGDEIDMTNFNVTGAVFTEFLRFIYFRKANLTMDNIRGIMNLAKQSTIKPFFNECEEFLIKNLSTETTFFAYDLALIHGASRLEKMCYDEICALTQKLFASPWFFACKHNVLERILRCDLALACDEKHIFNGCIAWAESACVHDNQNPTDIASLRAQLQGAVHQIRFGSMTMVEFESCISSYKELFTAKELHEIICMIGKQKKYKSKQFNWTPRSYDFNRDRHTFKCLRYTNTKNQHEYLIRDKETTTFTCSGRVWLKGRLTCEVSFPSNRWKTMNLCIHERRCGYDVVNQRLNTEKTIQFVYNGNIGSREANFEIEDAILLRPGFIYSIQITFHGSAPEHCSSPLALKSKVRVDHDIIFNFTERGIVMSFDLIAFGTRNYLWKIAHNPETWMRILATCIVLSILGTVIALCVIYRDPILHFFEDTLEAILLYFAICIIYICIKES